jgi:hypothetical protein
MINEWLISLNWIILPVTLFLGLFLIIFRPYWAFLFSIFVSLSMSAKTLISTRMQETGAFFNLYDACLIIALLSCFIDVFSSKNNFKMPKMALTLLTLVTLGFINTAFSPLRFSYPVLRAYRWAITLPMFFIIAANMVRDEKRVKSLLLTLVAATFLAEAQYYFLAASLNVGNIANEDPEALRSTLFELSSPEVWLLAGPYMIAGRMLRPWVQLGVGCVILAGFLLLQSRGASIAFFLTLAVYHLWFLKGPNAFHLKRIIPLIKICFAAILLLAIFNLTALPKSTWDKINRTVADQEAMEPRKNDAIVEGRDFLHGNIYTMLLGNGLSYYEIYYKNPSLAGKLPGKVGFGHVGYITYLSQLGIVGFLVYALLFPASVILPAKRLFARTDTSSAINYLAAVVGACFLYKSLWFIFTNSYLTVHIYPGILAGAMWRISQIDWVTSPSPVPKKLITDSTYGGGPVSYLCRGEEPII